MQRRLLFILIIATLISPAVFAADELVVYSGRSDKFIKPVVKAFTEATGIKVTLHSAKSTALINKLQLEGKRTTADLFISNDAGNLQIGADRGLFQAIPEKIVSVIPKNFRAADNHWTGLSARARVIVANSKANTDGIKSVFDLADPALKGRLAITNSTNESYIAGVTVYMQASDRDKTLQWLKGMKANVGSDVFNKHSKIVSAVAKGKKDVGLVNHYYIYRHLDKHPDAPLKVILPDQQKGQMGIAWNVAGVAISRHTKKLDAAVKLVRFLVSIEGQKIFADANREYPVRIGIRSAPEIPPASSFRVADVPMSDLGKQRGATIDLIEQAGMP